MIRTICHQLIKWYSRKNYEQFCESLKNPKKAQIAVLTNLTGISDYKDFKNHFPITNYADWKEGIEKRKVEKPQDHFVPTSGSTHAIKWIPYTKKFKDELWRASGAWIHDLYLRFPDIAKGTHYWSLSWIPEDLRKEHRSNDLDFFAGLEKYLLEQTMTVDESISTLPTLKESMRENAVSLIEKDVTLISVWSPTFLLELLDLVIADKVFFADRILDFRKKEALKYADKVSPELCKILFPQLALISAWATSSSEYYAQKVKELFPGVPFEAKGLWATEGVVTIPFQGKFPLAVNSHFYEFEDVETKEIHPGWALKKGMKVTPLLTTGSLFFRYRLNDLLLVSDFFDQTPCLTFLGRIGETDLVGEKISSDLAQKLLSNIANKYEISPLSLLAVEGHKPHYRLLVDGVGKLERLDEISDFLEKELLGHFHYKLARELGQLSHVQVEMKEDAYQAYVSYREKMIALKGNIKVEPLVRTRDD